MIRIVRSHRLEALADALADALAPQRAALDLAPDTIIVPSTAMARWVEARLAQRFGVAANLDRPYPAQFLWRTITQVLPDVPAHSPFDPETLAWRLYRLLDALPGEDDPALAPLQAYVRDADALTRMQLAERIATVFDRYLGYRGDAWLQPWAEGRLLGLGREGAEAWQAWLWRALLRDLGLRHDAHPFTRLMAVLAHGGTSRDSARAAGLPDCVRLFAVPTLAPVLWRAFAALGRHVDLECYVLAPSREYIADLVTEARRARVALAAPEAARLYEVGHPLVAANGRQAIDAQLVMLALEDEAQAQVAEVDEADEVAADVTMLQQGPSGAQPRSTRGAAPTLLQALQRSVVALDAAPALPANDASLQIHACHSLVRQLEVLHDALLRCFAADPSLGPADVLVCVPDLAAAASAIDAVFGAAPIARRIAYRMTGRADAQGAPLVAALLDLLDLAPGRANADAALGVLRVPACARRFGFDAAGLARAADWLAEAGARWGWDAAHRVALGLPSEARHTWADALERLVLGYAMPADTLFDGLSGIDGVEGTQAAVAAALLDFVQALHTLAQDLQTARNAEQWAAFFAQTLERFFAIDADEQADAARLRAACATLADAAIQAECASPIPFALARDRLDAALQARAPGGALTGAVTFAGLGPLRAIPARVIALLGMDDDAFPRRADTLEFDLTASAPQPGDRNRRDEDRALFLDALMAARDVLLIGYCGRDAREGTQRPPSVVVGELIDFVVANQGGEAGAPLVREHPLQAFSPRAFMGAAPSHARELLDAAHWVRQPVGARRNARLICTQPLPADESGARIVSNDELVRWLAHPAQHFLRERLRIALEHDTSTLADDEPFTLDPLEAHGLRARLVRAWRAGQRDAASWHALAYADAALPHGVPGDRAYQALTKRLREELEVFDALETRVGARNGVPVRLAVGPWTIVATLDGVHAQGVLGWRDGKVSMHARAQAWLAALLLSCADDAPRTAYWHCREGAVLVQVPDWRAASQPLPGTPHPRDLLAAVLQAYACARVSPLLCPPLTAWAMLSARAKDDDAQAARAAAERKAWRPSEREDDRRESEDPWWRALLGGATESVPDLADVPGAVSAFGADNFIALAERVYAPMHVLIREDAKSIKAYRTMLGVDDDGGDA